MGKRINNCYFMYILTCFLYGFGYVLWDTKLSLILYFVVASIFAILIIFSKGFYDLETYRFFRKNAFIFILMNLATAIVSNDSSMYKVFCLGVDQSATGTFLFWIILWFYHMFNGLNNLGNNQKLRRRWDNLVCKI